MEDWWRRAAGREQALGLFVGGWRLRLTSRTIAERSAAQNMRKNNVFRVRRAACARQVWIDSTGLPGRNKINRRLSPACSC